VKGEQESFCIPGVSSGRGRQMVCASSVWVLCGTQLFQGTIGFNHLCPNCCTADDALAMW